MRRAIWLLADIGELTGFAIAGAAIVAGLIELVRGLV